MKYPTKLSDTIHILLYIHINQNNNLSSCAIANSVETHPSYVRQIMADLKKAGIIDAKRGQATPTITRSLDAITVLDVYRAVEGDKPLLHQDAHTNPECSCGVQIQNSIKRCFDQIQAAAEAEMASYTLDAILSDYEECKKGDAD